MSDLKLHIRLTADGTQVQSAVRSTSAELDNLQATTRAVDAAQKTAAQSARAFEQSVARVGASQVPAARAAEQLTGQFNLQKNALQQVGYQVQDFTVQVASGQSALVAFGQQASQLAGVLGPGGALLGAVIAVGSVVANVLVSSLNSGKQAIEEIDTSVETLIDRLDELTVKQAQFAISKLEEQRDAIMEVGGQGAVAAARMETLRKNLEAFPNSKNAQSWADELFELEAAYDTYSQTINGLQAQIRQLEGRIQDVRNGNAGLSDSQKEATRDAQRYAEQLQIQGDAAGKTARQVAELALERLKAKGADEQSIAAARAALGTAYDAIEAEEKKAKAAKDAEAARRKAEQESRKASAAERAYAKELENLRSAADPAYAATARLASAKETLDKALAKGDLDKTAYDQVLTSLDGLYSGATAAKAAHEKLSLIHI